MAREVTPVRRVTMYDDLPPAEAAAKAWNVAGDRPDYHRRAQEVVRDMMPLVARALDRMEKPAAPASTGNN